MSFTLEPNTCPSNFWFDFKDEMFDWEDLKIIHTDPYYLGNGPRWKNK